MHELDEHIEEHLLNYNRRNFISKLGLGIGGLALSSMTNNVFGQTSFLPNDLAKSIPHFAPKAKRVVYLFQSGAPSQFELFDPKPLLQVRDGEELPDSVRKGQRLTGMTSNQRSFPMVGSRFEFMEAGKTGMKIGKLLPHIASVSDEICLIKSMHTEAINHDPAITFFQTGSQQPGRPSIGAWMSYGLGSENNNLPSFCVMLSRGTGHSVGQPLYSRLWGNGFLPSDHQGVQFRSAKDPVLYLNNPEGVSQDARRAMLNSIASLNQQHYDEVGDPETISRIQQYEMSFRMQMSVPEVTDLSDEPEETFELYGPESRKPGTYAANCLLARRLLEKDVRFVQLYHMGWDQHLNLPTQIKGQCYDVDQPSAALVKDLKRRGLLEDTLVIWGGEFGRTAYCQGKITKNTYGRDHHPKCFSLWMAGAGVKKGFSYGETDDFGYNIIENPVHVHDFQATIMHLMGIDHEKFVFRHQGRRFRLTDVHGEVVHDILS